MENNLNGRKINYIKLHGGDAFIPGIGGLGTTLPPSNKTLTMTMTHQENGVFLSVTGPRHAEVTIPWANIQLVVYGPQGE